MPACALAAQKNVVLHHSRPDERPAYAGMTVRGWLVLDLLVCPALWIPAYAGMTDRVGWCWLVRPRHTPPLWIADQVRNDGMGGNDGEGHGSDGGFLQRFLSGLSRCV